MAYTINSQKGYDLAQQTKKNPGQKYTASDGSQWWTDPGTGKLMVDHQGSTGEANLAYGKGTGSSSSSYSGGSGSSGAKKDLIYWVGTDKGRKVLENLYNGASKEYTASDGSRWYLGPDGNAYADHYGNKLQIQLRNLLDGGFGGFGGGSSTRTANAPRKGHDIQASVILTFEEAAHGCSKKITINRQDTCPDCGGTGSSSMVDSATSRRDAYDQQIQDYINQLQQMQGQKTPTAADQSDYIRQMYEQQLAANKAQLESDYNQNVSNLAGEESKIGSNYYEQRRQTQANADRAQANYNEVANASGLNTGTRGQAQLARSNQLQSDLTALNNAEAQNRAEIERQRTLLGQQYQNAIQKAQAENNMELAQRLYQEAVRVDESVIDASKNNSSRALEILNMMLGQISSDRNLASEEARQAAEIAAAGGKYGLYGKLYGLSDDVVKRLEEIYNKELADKELERELDIASKAKAANAKINRQYEYIKQKGFGI